METFLYVAISVLTCTMLGSMFINCVTPRSTVKTPDIAPPAPKTFGKVKPTHTPVKLTIKSVIRWEQLTGRPFSSLDYADSGDVEKLLYVSVLCCTNKPCTLEAFRITLKNEKLLKGFVQEIEKDGKIIAQFQQANTTSLSGQESGEPGYFKDIVYTLIQAGVNPHYLMNEAELCDLPELINAYERNKKEQMEASRLWTFLTILPHIDSKKIQSAKDMYPFPWEAEKDREIAEKAIQNDVELFEAFMKEGKNLFN